MEETKRGWYDIRREMAAIRPHLHTCSVCGELWWCDLTAPANGACSSCPSGDGGVPCEPEPNYDMSDVPAYIR